LLSELRHELPAFEMQGRGVRVFCLVVFCAALCLRVVAFATADSADKSYMGAWKFAGAVVAPWAPHQKPDAAERGRLMGKTIVFKAGAIAGPQPFACQGPRYKFADYTVDLLFQGAFVEMRREDKSVDPRKIAAGLGFKDKTIRTLETGCEFDFHFVDAATAQVGLNDYVYTLKKQ
jgi:hypothetical protein